MNVSGSISSTPGKEVILMQSTVVKRLSEYTRRRWAKGVVQLNQYQRQLVIHVLVEYHGFDPKQLIGLVGKSRSVVYSDLASIEFYKKTKQFTDDAQKLKDYILNPSDFVFY